jgi:hypothetical protein
MEICPTSPTFICNSYIKISVSKTIYLFSIKSRCKPAWILIENLFSWPHVLFVLLAEFLICLFWFRPTDLRGSLRVRPFSVGAILVRACSLCMLLRFFSRSGSPFHRRFISVAREHRFPPRWLGFAAESLSRLARGSPRTKVSSFSRPFLIGRAGLVRPRISVPKWTFGRYRFLVFPHRFSSFELRSAVRLSPYFVDQEPRSQFSPQRKRSRVSHLFAAVFF